MLAAVAVDRDELDRAQALLHETVLLSATAHDPVMAAGHAMARARLLLARGNARTAVEAADPGVRAVVPSPWAVSHEALVASAAHLAEGRPDRAAEVLQGVSGDQPACAVEAARALLAAGRPGAAVDLLDSIAPRAQTGPAVSVRAGLVRAQVADRAGTRPPPVGSSSRHSSRPGASDFGDRSSMPDPGSAPSCPPSHSASWPRAGSRLVRHDRVSRSRSTGGLCRSSRRS